MGLGRDAPAFIFGIADTARVGELAKEKRFAVRVLYECAVEGFQSLHLTDVVGMVVEREAVGFASVRFHEHHARVAAVRRCELQTTTECVRRRWIIETVQQQN